MFQALKKLLQKISKRSPGLLTIDRSQYTCSTSVSIEKETAIAPLETIATRSLQDRFPEYQFGKGTYDDNLQILSWGEGTTLRIGSFCSIAAGVQIFIGGEHRVDWISTYPFNVLWEAGKKIEGHPSTKGGVDIGNDVWIAKEAVILSGVKIGDGAVIGARAVVAKDVPPYAIVVGNPARIVRKRFDEDTIQKLLEIKWWDWDDTQIERFLPMILNKDTAAFLEAVDRSMSHQDNLS